MHTHFKVRKVYRSLVYTDSLWENSSKEIRNKLLKLEWTIKGNEGFKITSADAFLKYNCVEASIK